MEESFILLEKLPQPNRIAQSCCYCLNIQCGKKLLTILGILCAFTCTATVLIRDRKHLNATTILLITFLSLFIIITVMFVLSSVMLLLAALDESPSLMSYYIWLCIVFLCIQLILSVSIPLVLMIADTFPATIALVWMVIVMIVGLGWTHFISVVSTHRNSLLS